MKLKPDFICWSKLTVSSLVGSIRTVIGEGMPIYRNPFEKGNLFVKFEVTFPPNGFAEPDKLKVKIFLVPLSFVYNLNNKWTHLNVGILREVLEIIVSIQVNMVIQSSCDVIAMEEVHYEKF